MKHKNYRICDFLFNANALLRFLVVLRLTETFQFVLNLLQTHLLYVNLFYVGL